LTSSVLTLRHVRATVGEVGNNKSYGEMKYILHETQLSHILLI